DFHVTGVQTCALPISARGCRYLQMDDTHLAYLCDPKIRERTGARGDDPDALTLLYCRLVNDAIRDRPQDMSVCVHLCRGNFKSRSEERRVGIAWLSHR